MTLYELGEDYLRQNELLVDKIHRLTRELKSKKGLDYIDSKRDIQTLYKMSLELRETAFILMHYYDTDNKRFYHPHNQNRFTD